MRRSYLDYYSQNYFKFALVIFLTLLRTLNIIKYISLYSFQIYKKLVHLGCPIEWITLSLIFLLDMKRKGQFQDKRENET